MQRRQEKLGRCSFSLPGSAQSKDSLQSAQLQKLGRDDSGGSPLFATSDDGLSNLRERLDSSFNSSAPF